METKYRTVIELAKNIFNVPDDIPYDTTELVKFIDENFNFNFQPNEEEIKVVGKTLTAIFDENYFESMETINHSDISIIVAILRFLMLTTKRSNVGYYDLENKIDNIILSSRPAINILLGREPYM